MAVFIVGLITVVLLVGISVFSWQKWFQPQYIELPNLSLDYPSLKYETSEELSPNIPTDDLSIPNLPQYYGTDTLCLLVQNPQNLYAYWEITSDTIDNFIQSFGKESFEKSQTILRVYDITNSDLNNSNFEDCICNLFFDIYLPENLENYFFKVPYANHSYCLELGKILDGQFIPLLRSNKVHTPSQNLSTVVDEEWMWLSGIYQNIWSSNAVSSEAFILPEIRDIDLSSISNYLEKNPQN